MNNWQEFFSMGNHGDYVWSSYGMCLLVFVVLFVWFKVQKSAQINHIKDLHKTNKSAPRKIKIETVADTSEEFVKGFDEVFSENANNDMSKD